MNSSAMLLWLTALVVAVVVCVEAQQPQQFDEELNSSMQKRQMRNALVRFGRSSGMRNALVRFGKRAQTINDLDDEIKRNGAPQPFVRFGRSSGRPTDPAQDLLSSLQQTEPLY
uniref:Uncharacterized protein n=1 Tax=Ditylenchus dipsaci TaxID=166011 RepID=A0A915E0A0_9BILA